MLEWEAMREPSAVRVLARAGVLRPVGPGRALGVLGALRRCGATLAGAVAVNAVLCPDAPALSDPDGTLGYADLARAGGQVATALRRLGAGPDATIGLMCRNHRHFVTALLGAARNGADVVLLPTSSPAAQVAAIRARHGIDLVLHDPEFAGVAGDPARRADLALPPPGRLGRRSRPGRIIQLTSGTTGPARDAPRAPGAADVADLGLGLIERLGLTRTSTALVGTPLFHGMGLVGLALGLLLGGHVIVRPRFDAADVLADARTQAADTLVVVPEMLAPLITAGERPPTLRRIVTGGAPLRSDIAALVHERWGEVLYNAYGTTECGIATVATPADLRRVPGTVGRPLRGVTVGVSDGELTIDGHLTIGATARRTGDLGTIRPDGLIMLTGRADDLIISGGENVHPAEVEQAIRMLPDVDDVAVAGAPDRRLGQRVIAWVVRRPGSTIGADEIIGAVRAQLEAVKAPREVRFVATVPRTELGKIRRRELLGDL